MFLEIINPPKTLGYFAKFILFPILLILPVMSFAQQWNFEPVVRLTAEYDDNVELSSDDPAKIDSAAIILDLSGRWVHRTQSSETRITPRIRSKSYDESVFDNTNDLFVDFSTEKSLQRSDFGLQARFAQEDVRTAEIDDPDFDNPDINSPLNLDTGRVRVGVERDSIIFSPYFSHQWTETLDFRIESDYLDASYEQNPLNLRDFTDAFLATQFSYRHSDRSIWAIEIFGSDYESEAGINRSESQSVGASLAFRHNFSPTTEGRLSVGYEEVDTDVTVGGVVANESNNVTLFSAGLTKRGDISRIVLDVSQTVDPGGTGFLQERTQFRFRYTRQLSPKMFGYFVTRIQTTEELRALGPSIERDFRRYGLALEWRLTRKWSIRGDYTYTDQEFDQTVGSAESNRAWISFVYDPSRIN